MVCMLMGISTYAQKDTLPKFTVHFQQTLVEQYHPDFYSEIPVTRQYTSTGVGNTPTGGRTMYSGTEKAMSFTSTLFFGVNLTKNLEFYFNPEIAGGQGLSGVNGASSFFNGDIFRVGDPTPTPYIARAFFSYIINLNNDKILREEDQNILPKIVSSERIAIQVGKFSISDFFDQNVTSHDPRGSLLNWALMDNPSFDFPSNTRGYTYSANVKLVKKKYTIRISTALNALWSNGPVTDYHNFVPTGMDYVRAHGEIAEIIFPIIKENNATQYIKLMVWANHADMGSYAYATNLLKDSSSSIRLVTPNSNLVSPVMDSSRKNSISPYYGKYGFVINWERKFGKRDLIFMRIGANDGKRESFMYTESDKSISLGSFLSCNKIKRPNDNIRIGIAISDISKEHKDYLYNGGYGFIIGDGLGNYPKGFGPESVLEIQYNYQYKYINVSPDYQFMINPAFNQARGPINVFGIRFHIYL